MKLYELTALQEQLHSQINDYTDNDGVIDDSFADQMDAIECAIGEKMEAMFVWVAEMESEEDALAKEIKRLQAKKKAVGTNIDGVKAYAKRCFEQSGSGKLKTRLFEFRLQNNPPKTVITGTVPDQFCRVTVENDTEKIKESLKKGEILEFAYLETTQRLVVK